MLIIPKEVKKALHGITGERKISYRWVVVRDDKELFNLLATSGGVEMDKNREIQRTARVVLGSENGINWLHDLFRVYMVVEVIYTKTDIKSSISWNEIDLFNLLFSDFDLINKSWDELQPLRTDWNSFDSVNITWNQFDGQKQNWLELENPDYANIIVETKKYEYPLGTFIPASPIKSYVSGKFNFEVELYERTIILQQDKNDSRLYIGRGQLYTDAIKTILNAMGLSLKILDATNLRLFIEREYDPGTTYLEIVNGLLEEINYNPITTDVYGDFILTSYVEPSVDTITHNYYDNDISILSEISQQTLDLYNVPNVFIATVSNPDLDIPLHAVYVINNPNNILSTISRKRRIVAPMFTPNLMANQEQLEKAIRTHAFKSTQIYENINITTANMPNHGAGDILDISNPIARGVYEEQSWQMDLSYTGQMTHTLRRLVPL